MYDLFFLTFPLSLYMTFTPLFNGDLLEDCGFFCSLIINTNSKAQRERPRMRLPISKSQHRDYESFSLNTKTETKNIGLEVET